MPVCVRAAAHLPLGTLFLRPGGGRIFPSEHFFATRRRGRRLCTPQRPLGGGGAAVDWPCPPPPSRRPARPVCTSELPVPPLSRAAEHAGPAPACAAEPPPVPPPSRPYPAPLNTLAPPPGSTAEPPAPPCPAPLNALVPPRLHRRTPCPSPSRAAEHAGPLPVGAPETSPEGPQHAPESPFRGHLSKSRPRSWVFRGIFRTFECKKCLLQPIT